MTPWLETLENVATLTGLQTKMRPRNDGTPSILGFLMPQHAKLCG